MNSVYIAKLAVIVRICLGAIFLYSCVGKIADPAAFATIITNYQLFSQPWVTVTALVFPWVEAICGLALVAGRFDKGAALLVSVMMVVFIAIILYNGYRGLDIACGCFSVTAKEPSSITVNIIRNLIILAGSVWMLYRPPQPRQVTVS